MDNIQLPLEATCSQWEALVPVMFDMYRQANRPHKKLIKSEFIRIAKAVSDQHYGDHVDIKVSPEGSLEVTYA